MAKRVHRTKTTGTFDGKEITDEVEEERSSWFGIEAAPLYAAIVGALVGLLTAIVAVGTYYYQSTKDIETRTFEAKKPFFEKQTARYVDAMETVSRIAKSTTPSQGDLSHFWQLYWGPLAAVEGIHVDNVMVIFGKRLGDNPPARKECLTRISLLLAHCVKQSWSDTWHVPLDRPPELPCTDESFPKSFAEVSACK